ncbi:hypothetical protein, partial [Brachybacterium sp. Marseille-Q7125]|uniref:hypothetical protein n=1 Tax=Brachybacterium sp. Marseille-Q7125 TaxID=2932815 RepID=UPI001FF16F2E
MIERDLAAVQQSPQFIERPGEQGWRVIAYRHDERVDIFTDPALTLDPDERSEFTGAGRHQQVTTPIEHPEISTDEQGRLGCVKDFGQSMCSPVVRRPLGGWWGWSARSTPW